VDPAVRDAAVIDVLQALVAEHGRWGFWKCYDRIRLDGHPWNHKRLYRVYCGLRLNLPRRTRRRVPPRFRQALIAPTRLNEVWAIDFMLDALYGGRRFRTLNVLDEGNREGLAIEVGTSIPATRVIRVLSQLVALYGRPDRLRLDNGPELTSQVLTEWCAQRGIGLQYIQPGKPVQNAFIERFNRTYREEVLNAYLFHSTQEAQQLSDAWLVDYNERRPHDALGRVPPLTYLPRVSSRPESNNPWSA
jgi:putative transposase